MSGSNAAEVIESIKTELEQIKKESFPPRGGRASPLAPAGGVGRMEWKNPGSIRSSGWFRQSCSATKTEKTNDECQTARPDTARRPGNLHGAEHGSLAPT
jgi:hypothetical protein